MYLCVYVREEYTTTPILKQHRTIIILCFQSVLTSIQRWHFRYVNAFKKNYCSSATFNSLTNVKGGNPLFSMLCGMACITDTKWCFTLDVCSCIKQLMTVIKKKKVAGLFSQFRKTGRSKCYLCTLCTKCSVIFHQTFPGNRHAGTTTANHYFVASVKRAIGSTNVPDLFFARFNSVRKHRVGKEILVMQTRLLDTTVQEMHPTALHWQADMLCRDRDRNGRDGGGQSPRQRHPLSTHCRRVLTKWHKSKNISHVNNRCTRAATIISEPRQSCEGTITGK